MVIAWWCQGTNIDPRDRNRRWFEKFKFERLTEVRCPRNLPQKSYMYYIDRKQYTHALGQIVMSNLDQVSGCFVLEIWFRLQMRNWLLVVLQVYCIFPQVTIFHMRFTRSDRIQPFCSRVIANIADWNQLSRHIMYNNIIPALDIILEPVCLKIASPLEELS